AVSGKPLSRSGPGLEKPHIAAAVLPRVHFIVTVDDKPFSVRRQIRPAKGTGRPHRFNRLPGSIDPGHFQVLSVSRRTERSHSDDRDRTIRLHNKSSSATTVSNSPDTD